jgi:hypothetical protein
MDPKQAKGAKRVEMNRNKQKQSLQGAKSDSICGKIGNTWEETGRQVTGPKQANSGQNMRLLWIIIKLILKH